MTVSPLDMPARRPVKVAVHVPVRLAWVTETGDAPLPPKRDVQRAMRAANILADLERDGLLTVVSA